jgi:hypothetical protein
MGNKKDKGKIITKLSPEDAKKKLLDELFGPDFKTGKKYSLALEQAKRDIRQKKLQATQASISAGGVAAANALKAAKRHKASYKDYVMEVLSHKNFFGIYLRVQFWI